MRLVIALVVAACTTPTPAELPRTLRDTGLYADDVRPFVPQYPLWTDGATKRRWIALPPGTAIDASDPDAWQFPVGTRLWKEFSFGRRVETRYMERTAEAWRYATYAWTDNEALLAPETGMLATAAIDGTTRHRIPSVADCRACHATGPTPVLGFSALQLSTARDRDALHAEPLPDGALDLGALVAEGRVHGIVDTSPQIIARSPTERAALGYLHGNCGGCHREASTIQSLELVLASSLDDPGAVVRTTVGRTANFRLPTASLRVAPGDPAASVLLARVRSRAPAIQMPPLGTQLVDDAAARLLSRWIAELELSPRRTP